MKIIEKRCLLPYDLQKFLIEEKLYTVGSDKQLYKLMEYVDKCMDKATGLTTEDIVNIAINIQNHSKTEYWIITLCYHINKLCEIIFIDEEESL